VALTELEGIVRIVCLVLIVAGLIAAVTFAVRVIVLCRRQGIALLKIEDKALSAASLQTVLLLFATLIGGLWVVYTVAVSGTLDLQQLTTERERRNQDPNVKIDLHVDSLTPLGPEQLTPVHIQAVVENKGVKEIRLTYRAQPGKQQPPPLLLIGKLDPARRGQIDKEAIETLPYVSLDCPNSQDCRAKTWSNAALESGGTGYYSFLHVGLTPGLYYVQFQLAVPTDAISVVGEFNPNAFVVWTRAKYFEVEDPKVVAARKASTPTVKN
jgi:hypothetical protein